MRKKSTDRQGSTVIEVLIATTVVAFALTGLAILMTANVKNSAEADYREAGSQIAQNAMENARQNKNTVSWNTFKASPVTGAICQNSQKLYNTDFYVDCTLTPAPEKLDLSIKVCWPQTGGVACTAPNSIVVKQTFYNY